MKRIGQNGISVHGIGVSGNANAVNRGRKSSSTQRSTLFSVLVVAVLLTSTFGVIGLVKAQGGASEQFQGYNKDTGKWVNANLGSAYVEGDFVSYELQILSTSKAWGNDFSISFNFYQPSSGAVYVDGFDTSSMTGFQYTSTGSFLPDGRDLPTGSPALVGWPGTHIPTTEAGESWSSGPRIINYMHAYPEGTSDGTPAGSAPTNDRYFTVSGLPWETFTSGYVILFFRAHLATTIIWINGLESALPQQLDGNAFQTWTNAWQGSSAASGSSRHFSLVFPGIGDKTIPIPIATYPSTTISGHKYVVGALFNGWQITLTGMLALGPGMPAIPYSPPSVQTGQGVFVSGGAWPTGYFEFTGLVTGSYVLTEEDRAGYGHVDILVGGAATNVVKSVPGGTVSFDLQSGMTATVDFYNSIATTTTTQLSATTITLGQSVTDTATVTSSVSVPTGSVQFWVRIGAGSFTLFSTKTLDSNGQATSDPYTPLSAGSYSFKAIYGGGSNFLPSQSGDNDEPLNVGPATPMVKTVLSSTTITLGGTVTDTVTVTGLSAPFPMPTGTVQFYVKAGAGSWTLFSTKTLGANGQATSDPYTPLTAGSYNFKAMYLGDTNYNGAQSGDTDEPLNVAKYMPAVSTLLSASTIALGGTVTDKVTVAGLPAPFPMPTGAVQFQVSKDGGATWTTFSTKNIDTSGVAVSDPYKPSTAGDYLFRALYAGDGNYKPAQSGDNSEPLSVTGQQTGTMGFWKNHLGDWVGVKPTDKFPWTTGRAAGFTYIQILNMQSRGDATIILADQYIAAVLNANAYGVPSSVSDMIAHAEYLFSHGYPVGSNPSQSDPVTAEIITLAGQLQAYNMSGD